MNNYKYISFYGIETIPKFLQNAARDFENHLIEIFSGQELLDVPTIELVLEQSEKITKKLHNNKEGFIISSNKKRTDSRDTINFILKGLTARSLMYACYGLLHHLGIRWYFPGDNYTLTREIEDVLEILCSEIHLISIPAFKKRGIVIYRTNDLFDEWLKYSMRTRMNYIVLHSEDGLELSDQIYHQYGLYLSLEEHIFDKKICSNNSARFSKAYTKVKRKLHKIPSNPDTNEKELYFWLADTIIRRCSCSKHQEWNAAEVHLDFVNHLIEKLNRENPKIKFSWLAYMGSFKAIRKLKPHPNIILEIAPMHRCFNHSIKDPDCLLNWKKVLTPINQLKELFPPENRQVLGYWLDPSLFGRQEYLIGGWAREKERGRVPHIPFIMQEDIQFYHNNDFKNILTFAVNLDRKYCNTYTSPLIPLYPLLCWNPESDIEKELKKFNHYYLGLTRSYPLFLKNEKIDPKEVSLKELRAFYFQWNGLISYIKQNSGKIRRNLGDKLYQRRVSQLLKEYRELNRLRKRYVQGKIMGYLWQKGLRILELLLS